MNNLLVFIIVFIYVCFDNACSTSQDTNKTFTIERTIEPTDGELEAMEEYHESDDLTMRTTDMSVYLNQTSPDCDTIYVYHY